MRKFTIKSKKGVSPIIATLLLIIIAVAAAVVTYSFVMGFFGTNTPSGYTTEKVSVDQVDVTNEKIYVRNIDNQKINVTAVYAIKTGTTSGPLVSNGTAVEIDPGAVVEIELNLSGLTTGSPYTLKVVCKNGGTAFSQEFIVP